MYPFPDFYLHQSQLLTPISVTTIIVMVFPYHAFGTLQDLLNTNGGSLNEECVKFYAAQMLLILEHLRNVNIAHRDIKPDNIMIEKDGYLQLIDFGLATRLRNGLKSFSGTPEYIAPEVLQEKTWSARYLDMWSWGCLMYKMLYGVSPFEGPDATSVFLNTLTSPIRYPKIVIKSGGNNVNNGNSSSNNNPSTTKTEISDNAKNLINKVLERKYDARPTMEEIKNHPFFNGIDWDKLLKKEVKSPIFPLPNDQLSSKKSMNLIPSSKVSDMFNSI